MDRPREEWQKVKPSWEQGERLIKAFGSAIYDALLPEDSAQVQQRINSCKTCEWLRYSLEYYCGACGCGVTPISTLDLKIRLPYLECPLKKQGFNNHE
jgi:hypothetical protein